MSLTINPTLFKRKKKKDGSIPVYLRITKDRKSTYIATGISVQPSQWNDTDKSIRKSHPKAAVYNKYLKNRIYQLETEYLSLDKPEQADPQELKKVLISHKGNDLFTLLDEYRQTLNDQKRFYDWKKIGTIHENLKAFTSGKKTDISKINPKFADDFQNYLLQKIGNNPKTTNRKLSCFRGFINWLVTKGLLESDPYTKIKVVRPSESQKVRLTIEQIKAIQELDLVPNSSLWHTRNYFMYSFFNAGIRFGDVCTLRWDNIIDGRLIYKMSKTGASKSIKQTEPQLQILAHYKKPETKGDDYIFPILRKKHTDSFLLKKEISSRNVVVNKNLKQIAELAKIETNVSFHIARHTFSQFALKKGMDLYSISKALGHSDLKITEQYLNSFDEELLDKSMENLFG